MIQDGAAESPVEVRFCKFLFFKAIGKFGQLFFANPPILHYNLYFVLTHKFYLEIYRGSLKDSKAFSPNAWSSLNLEANLFIEIIFHTENYDFQLCVKKPRSKKIIRISFRN